MSKAFLSYENDDLKLIKPVADALAAQGIAVWRDKDKLAGGQKWPKELGEAIAAQDFFLLAWSENAAKSQFVEFEWNTAIALGKTIIPCLLDNTPLPVSLRANQGILIEELDQAVQAIIAAIQRQPTKTDHELASGVIKQLAVIKTARGKENLREVNAIFTENKGLAKKWQIQISLVAVILVSIFAIQYMRPIQTIETASPIPLDTSTSDLFEAVQKDISSGKTERDGGAALSRRINAAYTLGERVTALFVMTAGGSSTRESESRFQDRYAVNVALEAGCFKREKTPFLSYLTWQFEKKPVATPYEWYHRSKITACQGPSEQILEEGNDRHVLVLWLAAEESEEVILQRIDVLLSKFHQPNVTAKLVGPRSSSEFRTLLQEIEERGQTERERGGKKTKPFSWQKENRRLALYSPWATAMPGLLAYGLKGTSQSELECRSYAVCNNLFNQLLWDAGLDFQYSTDSDRVLFESLFGELNRRQVTVGKDLIVLIGEWDSFYARALPLTFSAAACHYITDSKVRKASPPSEFLMRKLKGKCATTEEGVDQLKKGEISPQELNIGQYNYFSGLEKDTLKNLVSNIKSDESSHSLRVKAIAILGQDAQETLLILHDMRKHFPAALFFTTDLNSEYLHESQQQWARNLLVVSHFGLQLDRPLQQAIPPFRNTYQTSTFFAVLRAIGHVTYHLQPGNGRNMLPTSYALHGGNSAGTEYSTVIRPRLFEFGRHGAVDLSVDNSHEELRSVHPGRQDVEGGAGRLKMPERTGPLWGALVVLLCLSIWSSREVWDWLTARDERDRCSRNFKRVLRPAWVPLLIFGAVLLWYTLRNFNYVEDEPFSWSDGISIWPTELLRVLAGLLCVWFMIKARTDLAENTTKLTHSFFPLPSQTRSICQYGFWSNLGWMSHGSHHTETINADDLWLRYCTAHHWRHHTGRITLLYIVYMASIAQIFLFWIDDSRFLVPCRGDFSCGADKVVFLLSVFLSMALTLSVLDSVWLCIRWINELSRAAGLNARSAVRLLAERTRTVKRVIPYPLVVTIILLGARSHYFDNWDSHPGFNVMVSTNSLFFLGCAFAIYIAETRARREMIEGHGNEADTV